MARETIQTTLTELDGEPIQDPTSVNWRSFNYPNGFKTHYIEIDETLRPYRVSERFYDTPEYIDMILFINNIDDPINIVPGTELKIPLLNDLLEFILETKRKNG
jgi:hypothetical protein